MKKLILLLFLSLTASSSIKAQTNFNADDYLDFLKQNQNLSSGEFLTKFSPKSLYYNSIVDQSIIKNTAYLDSVTIKCSLTPDELGLLEKNSFVVTERLKNQTFFNALVTIFNNDLPLFITTDTVLETVHLSYDKILSDLEERLLKENLETFLESLYGNYNNIYLKYAPNENMHAPLADVDIFVTIAHSLLNNTK